MRPSSSPSDGALFAGVLARGDAAALVSDQAWLQALLDAESALAGALADIGLITSEDAEAIAAACVAERFDVVALGAASGAIGNPAGSLVDALKAAVGEPAAEAVHRGATSQDIVDTAAMLLAQRALVPLLGDLADARSAARALAAAHRDTPIAGRTLLQQAVPTTFGLKAAGWMLGLHAAHDGLARVRETRLAAQLGGAAGTLAAFGATGPAVAAQYAARLGLPEPALPWHTERSRIGELAGALGVAAGAVAKPARDVTLLAQTEVGEVREGTGGGSTAMAHKANPVAAIAALGCARQAPGLVATLLASAEQEHERAAGAWHAEWRPLTELLRTTGSAAAWLRTSLEDLRVDPVRMAANLAGLAAIVGAGTGRENCAALVDRALSVVDNAPDD